MSAPACRSGHDEYGKAYGRKDKGSKAISEGSSVGAGDYTAYNDPELYDKPTPEDAEDIFRYRAWIPSPHGCGLEAR